MQKSMMLAAVLAGAALAVQPAGATTIYSTLGPGNSYFTNSGWGFEGVAGGFHATIVDYAEFAPAANYDLDRIDVALFHTNGINDGARISLWSRSGSQPDMLLASWSTGPLHVLGSGTSGIVTIAGITGIELKAGKNYDISVGPLDPTSNENAAWNFNSQHIGGTMFTQWSTIGWVESFGAQMPAFDVIGAKLVPEPASIALMIGGTAGAMRLRRRKGAK